ncbi:hypothetical protein C1H46_029813 [Malus baccata]|uniref:Uncharacterized protein n=1 Tax=Malus baccata TaxID=106549 RepID=A0A540LDU1_MALBA|nr:hypothetical protein C1H46_029813 [Malus baccata]
MRNSKDLPSEMVQKPSDLINDWCMKRSLPPSFGRSWGRGWERRKGRVAGCNWAMI